MKALKTEISSGSKLRKIPLTELAEINPSRSPRDCEPEADVSFIPMGDTTESGRWINRQTRKYREVRQGFTFFEEGDVLFAKITPCMENGKGCLAIGLSNGIGFGSTEFHVLRAREGADAGFIYQWSTYQELRRQARNAMTGSAGQQRVPKEFFSKFLVPQLAKPEQTKIAEILSTVDRAIEQTEALIAKQQRIKTGLMQDLLTRGIDEHGNLRSEETHEFKDSPLGRIPVEWEVLRWSEVCSKIQDGTHFSPRTDSSADFKYVTSKNIKFGFLDMSDVEYIDKRQHDEIYKRCDVCLGDVLLTKDGANTGNAAINLVDEEFSLLSSVAMIRPMKRKLTSMFLLQTILSESGQRLIKDAMSGLAITRVTLEIIKSFLMKVPPIQEQITIGQFLAVQDERIKSETNKLAKLRSLKIALMQDLLAGKKRVTALLKETEGASE